MRVTSVPRRNKTDIATSPTDAAASGKLGFPEQSMLALALGCDMSNVAREAVLAIGCTQAQQCHTGHCPTGITTRRAWLVSGFDPTLKAARLANYLITLRKEILQIAAACGEPHPALVPLDRFDIVDGFQTRGAREVFGYKENWRRPGSDARDAIRSLEGPLDDAAA